MRYEVPKFIEVEDKIIGPLTWRQFVYLAGGAGMLAILYFKLPFMFFLFLGLPLGALAFSLAFHRINNRPFSIFLESAVNYFTKNKLYLWKKDKIQTIKEKQPQIPKDLYGDKRKSITTLSHRLEHQIPE